MSGNGLVGGADGQVHMLVGPIDAPFASALTASDFTNARNGPSAVVVDPNPFWITSLSSNSSARWVSTSATGASSDGASALYAITFTIPTGVHSAMLDLRFAVDNQLGSPAGPGVAANQGVFLNGTALPGSTTAGSFTEENTFMDSNIGPLLVSGENTLYINATDTSGPAGLLFSATIIVTPVPEPATALVAGGGLTAVAGLRRRLRRRA